MVKVSVIIPVYNTGKYLEECIESVIQQTLSDMEIIIVNDGSTDNSADIINEYASKDKRIRVFHEQNRGVAAARNLGMDNASGEYLYFLDSDDMIVSNFFETAYNIAKANDSDLTICDDRNFSNLNFYQIAAVPTYGIFVKREFLNKYPDLKFPIGVQPSEDGLFSHLILILTNKISFCPLNHYFYRQHDNQNSNIQVRLRYLKRIIDHIPVILSKLEDFYNKYNLWDDNYYLLATFIQDEIFLSRYQLAYINVYEQKKTFNYIHDFFCRHLIKYLPKNKMNSFNPAFKALVYSSNYEMYILNRKLHDNNFIHENYLIYRFLKNHICSKAKYVIKKIKNKKAAVKFIHPDEKKFMNNFFNNINRDRVLVVEMNDFHNEVIPGYLKYLNELGYETDVLITSLINKDNVFFNIPQNLYKNLYHTRYFIIEKLLKSPEIKKYKKILITSNYIYLLDDLLTNFKNLNDSSILFVDHNIRYVTDEMPEKHKIICLNNFNNDKFSKNVVNPHYFGNIKITPKNDITQFLIVGRINNARQNYKLITETINKLKNKNVFNYKITLVGFDLGGEINPLLANEINLEYKGHLNFKDLYEEIEKADFLLNLFDDENPEHKKYKECVTSGQIQLSYGFLKPSVVNESFAPYFGYDKSNSLLFKNNDDFVNVIEQAINMSDEDYEILQNNLKTYTGELYEKSLNNLKGLVNDK